MDEATASIDEMTDKLIQYMIKKELQGVSSRKKNMFNNY